MQIHEITKGRKRTDEGILDDLKAAVTATKTGFKKGGVTGALKNLTSNSAYAAALQQNTRASSMKNLDKLEKKWQKEKGDPNFKVKRPISYYVDQVKADPEAKAERSKVEASAEQKFVLGDVLPDPGQFLVVTSNNGKYFKDSQGKWYNEQGTATTGSNKILDAIIDTDAYSQITVPPWKQVIPQATQKTPPVTPAVAPTQPANKISTTALAEGPLADRARQRNAGITNPVQQSVATAGKKPANLKGKVALRKGFEQWLGSVLSGFSNIAGSDKSILDKQFKRLLTTKAEADLDQYILLAQALILKANNEGGSVEDAQTNNGMSNELLQRLKQTGFKSQGNAEQDAYMRSLGIAVKP